MEKEFKMSNDDCAVWISLLAKSEGLASAEKYFDSLEKSANTRKTYGALLNCYCDDKNLEKASNLFEKIKEANAVRRGNIFSYATLLRRLKKYDQAKQMYEWIEKNDKLTKADHAIRLDILSKTKKESAKAEKYFDRREGSSKNKKSYGSLLNYYCKGKKLDKALKLFEEIKELNYASTTNYNRMLNLYMNMGQPEKVILLAEETEENNIAAYSYTYIQLLRSYASLEDLDAVEKVIKKMKTNDVKCDWFIFGNLATIYVNAGLFEKANAALRDMEEFENLRDLEAFHTLITLYAKTSNVSGVKRSWDSLKVVFPKPKNVSYLIVLLALSKLGEVDALEKYFIDWETDCSEYDVRIANVILKSYLKRDTIEKAELVYDNIMRTGAEPSLTTYEAPTNYHLKKGQIDLALKFLDVGVLKAKQWKRNWFPTDEIIK